MQVKAAENLSFAGLAISKRDPINRGDGAQYIVRPPPAGAMMTLQYFTSDLLPTILASLGRSDASSSYKTQLL